MADLKPCPFCGATPEYLTRTWYHLSEYHEEKGWLHPDNDCILRTKWIADMPDSIRKWNMRNEKHCSNCKYSYGLRCNLNCGPIEVCSEMDKWEKSRYS